MSCRPCTTSKVFSACRNVQIDIIKLYFVLSTLDLRLCLDCHVLFCFFFFSSRVWPLPSYSSILLKFQKSWTQNDIQVRRRTHWFIEAGKTLCLWWLQIHLVILVVLDPNNPQISLHLLFQLGFNLISRNSRCGICLACWWSLFRSFVGGAWTEGLGWWLGCAHGRSRWKLLQPWLPGST